VLEEAMKTLTLLGWSKYGEEVPTIEFIADRRMQQIKAVNAEPSADEKRWGALLDEYGFLYFGEFDKVLHEGWSKDTSTRRGWEGKLKSSPQAMTHRR
jgi:hypothetical protein